MSRNPDIIDEAQLCWPTPEIVNGPIESTGRDEVSPSAQKHVNQRGLANGRGKYMVEIAGVQAGLQPPATPAKRTHWIAPMRLKERGEEVYRVDDIVINHHNCGVRFDKMCREELGGRPFVFAGNYFDAVRQARQLRVRCVFRSRRPCEQHTVGGARLIKNAPQSGCNLVNPFGNRRH